MNTALFVIVGYLFGSIPTGYWLVRALRGEDIRKTGSGNIGATNVWRTYGAKLGVPVMFLDTMKGFVPALLATIYVGHLAGVLAGGAAMLGHWRPLFMRFAKGGKAVATCGGAFFGVAPVVGAQILIGLASVAIPPAIAAISLRLVGRPGFARRAGRQRGVQSRGQSDGRRDLRGRRLFLQPELDLLYGGPD